MDSCTVLDCDRPRRSKGQILCHGHQSQKQRGKPFSPLGQPRAQRPVGDTKLCPKCGDEKLRSGFYKNRSTTDGLCTYCADCSKVYDKQRVSKSREARRARYLQNTYDLTWDEWEALFESQGRVCAICGVVPDRPVVDHCHDTGKVRGILCDNCNRSLGLLKDSVDVLVSAASYLIQHEDVLSTVGGE